MEELNAAQTIYEKLADYGTPVRPLLKPSKFVACIKKDEVRRKSGEDNTEQIEEVTENLLYVVTEENETQDDLDKEMEEPEECEEENEKQESTELEPEQEEQDVEDCETIETEISECSPKPKSCSTGCLKKQKAKSGNCKRTSFSSSLSPKRTGEPCKRCKKKTRKLIDTPLCPCSQCVEDRKRKSINYVISGTKITDSGANINIIGGVVEKKPCKCLDKYEAKIEEYETFSKKVCKCREENQKMIDAPLCDCEKCEEKRKQKSLNYVISGVKQTESGGKISIVEGVALKRPCKCLHKYEKKINQYEAYSKRLELVKNLKEQQHKYVIGGVVNRPEGPVYIISGMRPPIDCKCAKEMRAELEEKRRLANMPKLPPGRIKYEIAGVRQTPEGCVYILNQALPIDDCDCMEVYQKYEKRHEQCLKLYEDYVKYMENDIQEYMEEMGDTKVDGNECGEMGDTKVDDNECGEECDNNNEQEQACQVDLVDEGCNEDTPCQEKCESEEPDEEIMNGKAPVVETKKKRCKCGKKTSVKKTKGCRRPPPPCKQCICGVEEPQDCVDCTCAPPPVEEPPVIEEPEEIIEEPPPAIKRFFIYKKIKCDRKWQLQVLEKALATLAEDGFPLAKLPDCHKLPHFRLWMEMRCGRFWTQYDRCNFF